MYSPNDRQLDRIKVIMDQDIIPQHWQFAGIYFDVTDEVVTTVQFVVIDKTGIIKTYSIDQQGGGNVRVIY